MYQQILDNYEVDIIRAIISENAVFKNDQSNLAGGRRQISELNIDLFPGLKQNINRIYGHFDVQPIVRIYIHEYGYIKPHIDVSAFNICDKTMIIYLTQGHDGELHLNIDGKIISYSPKIGYAIAFDKSIVHWVNEFYSPRILMVIDLLSNPDRK